MAKTTSKKKSTKKLTFGQRFVRWIVRPLPLSIVAILATSWLCWPSLRDRLPSLSDKPEYIVGIDQIVVTKPPRWVPEDLVERVFERAGFEGTLSLQDPKLSEKIALAFHTHPWVERLSRVSKSYPPRVTVDLVYREPVAMVELVSGGHLPVDRHGFLLPAVDFSPADTERYPVIRNVTSIPVRRGESWGDPAVAGAAELAAILVRSENGQPSWWRALGLEAIIVPRTTALSEDATNLQYKFVTPGGSEILWGRAPGTQYPGELKVAQKLERMAEYHRSYNGFDDAPAPFVIDVRDWQGTRRGLLAREPSAAVRQ